MGWALIGIGILLLAAVAVVYRGTFIRHRRSDSLAGGVSQAVGRGPLRAVVVASIGGLLIALGIPALFVNAVAVAGSAIMLLAGVVMLCASGALLLIRLVARRHATASWFLPAASALLVMAGFVGLGVSVAGEPTAAQPPPAGTWSPLTPTVSSGPSAPTTLTTGQVRSSASQTPAGQKATPKTSSTAHPSPGTSGPTSTPSPSTAPAEPPTPTAPVTTPAKRRAAATVYAVLRVVDGDTVHVAYHGNTTVRIIGINTPETVDPNEPVECGGPAASREAHKLLDGQRVRLVFDRTQGRLDKYGRTLAYIDVPGVGDYGYFMIRHGYAFEYTYDTAYHRRSRYLSGQSYARAHQLGVWGHCGGRLKPLRPAGHTHAPEPKSRVTKKPSSPPSRKATQSCTPGYSPCLPPAADWDCSQLRAKGLTPVRVTGSDPYRLDRDKDGVGCED